MEKFKREQAIENITEIIQAMKDITFKDNKEITTMESYCFLILAYLRALSLVENTNGNKGTED